MRPSTFLFLFLFHTTNLYTATPDEFEIGAAPKASTPPSKTSSENIVIYEGKLNPYPYPISIPIMVKNRAYSFLLDTGSSVCVFDTKLTNLLGPKKTIQTVPTLGRDIKASVYDSPLIAIKSFDLPSSVIVVLDCDPIAAVLGEEVSGLIGAEALKDSVLLFDFDNRTLKIATGAFTPPTPMNSERFDDTKDFAPVIELRIDDRVIPFTIDTGDTACIRLQHDAFIALAAKGFIKLDKYAPIINQGLSGSIAGLSGWFTRGQLLGRDLQGVPVLEGNKLSDIGIPFLLNFNVVMDFKSRTMFYRMRKVSPPLRAERMLGALLKFSEGHNHIDALFPNRGAAEIAGLQIGDRIMRLGPLRESEINCESLYELCLSHSSETLEVEVIRSGESKSITTHLTFPAEKYIYPASDPTNCSAR